MVNYHQGDIILLDFTPQKGHEQSGRRPALVLSNDILNQHSSMALVCPITNTNKQHPLHIELDDRTETTGVILCEQAKMLDIRSRNGQLKEKCPSDITEECIELVKSLL